MMSQIRNLANTPEPAPVNEDETLPALWDLVISDFEKRYCGDEKVKKDIVQLMHDRDAFGFEKYHCHLKNKNGRSFYRDLLSELLDACVYAKGLSREKDCFDENLYNTYTDILKLLVRLYEIHLEENG
jgi:hypothetical protein